MHLIQRFRAIDTGILFGHMVNDQYWSASKGNGGLPGVRTSVLQSQFKMISSQIIQLYLNIILIYYSPSCGAIRPFETPKRDARRLQVVGGQPVNVAEYPFLVSLRDTNGAHTCGGALIKPDIVLTAAHCVTRPGKDTSFQTLTPSVLSSANVQSRRSSARTGTNTTLVHPKFNQSAWYEFDIAILVLEKNLTDAAPVEYGPLEKSQEQDLRIAGWGDVYFQQNKLSKQLMEAQIYRIPQSTCQQWGESFLSYGEVTDAMICASDLLNSRDACRGDSGGPLIAKKRSGAESKPEPLLVGVNSWSIACGNAGFPGVYTSIDSTKEWIDAVVSSR